MALRSSEDVARTRVRRLGQVAFSVETPGRRPVGAAGTLPDPALQVVREERPGVEVTFSK